MVRSRVVITINVMLDHYASSMNIKDTDWKGPTENYCFIYILFARMYLPVCLA